MHKCEFYQPICIACLFCLLTAHTGMARLCGKGAFKNRLACLQELLKDQDRTQRRDAVIALSALLKPTYYESERSQALPVVIEALEDSDAEIRLEALKLLINGYGTEATPAEDNIRNMLKDSDLRIQLYADAYFKQVAYDASKDICPFSMKKEEQFSCLVSGIDNPNVFVRRAALKELETQTPTPSQLQQALPVLIKAVQDKDVLVRRHALYTIYHWGDKKVYVQPQLYDALKDPDELVRLYAEDCIERAASNAQREANIGSTRHRHGEISRQRQQGKYYEEALKTLYSFSCTGRYTGSNLKTLASYGRQESDNLSLVYRICDSCTDSLSVRAQAVKTMAAIGEPDKALPLIMGALEDQKPMVREAAAESIGKIGIGYPKAIAALTNALADKDPDVVIASISALGLLKAGSAVEQIRNIMENYQNKSSFDQKKVRKAAQAYLKEMWSEL